MSDDADHEVIDSPEALFRHLYEAHQVQEAVGLDPVTAPVQYWLRRHAELERVARLAAARERRAGVGERAQAPAPVPPGQPGGQRPAPPGPDPGGRPGGGGRFVDPLVEAVVLALAGRGHDERRVRAFVSAYGGPDGRRTGPEGLRAAFIAPMLDAIADRLGQAAGGRQAPAGAARIPEPSASDDVMAIADVLQGRRGGRPSRAEARQALRPDDDVMAIADAVQRRRSRSGPA
jgi:hypothetical protein